ncbi:MAG TPA: class I SAM-dependent methyltransferase [Bryobacteraceae bacterium]|nr:class I SAM-dependent methyltransferase [Bryobacteraceae bacterium]
MTLPTSLLLAFVALPAMAQPTGQRMAPYVPSPQEIIDRMLEVAHASQGDTVIDVGCGDGRILITAVQKFRTKAIGIEIDPKIAAQASDMILRLGLQNKARVVRANVFDADLSQADVVTLYLTTTFNEKLRPKFEKSLRPGTRVVSHDYGIRGWNPVEVEEVFVHGRRHRIFLYVVEGKKN